MDPRTHILHVNGSYTKALDTEISGTLLIDRSLEDNEHVSTSFRAIQEFLKGKNPVSLRLENCSLRSRFLIRQQQLEVTN